MAASVKRQAGSSILTSQKMMKQNFYMNQYRQFSNEKKPEQEESSESQKEEPTKEEPKKDEPSSSAFPLIAGLGLIGAGGFMMMSGGGNKEEKKSEEKTTTPVATTAATPAAAAAPAKEAPAPPTISVEGHPDLVDVEITGASDLDDGMMMELKVGAGKKDNVLITRYQGKLYAIGAYCSHFGAPLVNGVLFDDKVLCPWHAAGFSVTSGAIEYAPGLDGVPKYGISEKDGKHFVRVPKKMKQTEFADMAKRDPSNTTKMVIVGGGAAGLNCAETLRQSGYTGQIQVISNEKVLPYDRTLLSKGLATMDASKLTTRKADFLDEYGIEFQLGYEAKDINKKNKEIILSDGSKVPYDKLLIATGGQARVPRTPGIDLKNVHVLRSANDQTKIKEAAKNAKQIVVVGGGFIASEVTASLQKKYNNVHMLCDFNAPMDRYFGYDVGAMILSEHEKNGAKVYCGVNVFNLKYVGDKDGNVKKVVLENGYEIDADLVVVGAGNIINTDIAKAAGLDMDKNGGVKCNPFMQTSDPDIFAAGDIASFPCWYTGTNLRIEHWITALDQGTHAAFNMLGKMVPYGNIPFFWTNHYGKGMQYVGNAMSWDEIHIDGIPRDNKFIAYYIKDNKILAACAQGRGKDLLTIFEAMNQNVLPPADQIKNGTYTPSDIQKMLKLNKNGGACRRANCCQKKSIVQ